jgi:hypothetical protein
MVSLASDAFFVLKNFPIAVDNIQKVLKDFLNNNDPDIQTYCGKPLIDLVSAYLLKIDHGIGRLLSRLLAKHIGI